MIEQLQNKDAEKWLVVERIICFAIFLFYMVGKLNYYLFDSILHSYCVVIFTVLSAFCLYFYRLQEGRDFRILALFWLWYTVSRILGGDVVLKQYGILLLSLAACFLFTGVGIISTPAQRENDMKWFCISIIIFSFIMGLICLYGMFLRKSVLNPITGSFIVVSSHERFVRMGLFEMHSNLTAAFFMMPVFAVLYELSSCKNWKAFLILSPAFLVFLLCIGLTYSRNGMICTALGVALYIGLGVFRSLKTTKNFYRIAAVILVLLIVVPLGYKTIGSSVTLFGKASASYLEHSLNSKQQDQDIEALDNGNEKKESTEDDIEKSSENVLFEDKRSFVKDARTLTARTPLFRSVFLALKEEPIRILIGENDDEKMLYYANNVVQTSQHFVHMHNFFLQTLMVTGLLGLLLVAWFCIRLVFHCARVFFNEKKCFQDQMFVLPVICYLLFFQLESGLFTDVTTVTIFFFLMSGYVIAVDGRID